MNPYRIAARRTVRIAARSLEMFFARYRTIVEIGGRTVVYPCRTLEDAAEMVVLNEPLSDRATVVQCGLICHPVLAVFETAATYVTGRVPDRRVTYVAASNGRFYCFARVGGAQ